MGNTEKQHTLWLLTAIAAPAAHFAGCGWLTALSMCLAVLPLTLIPKRWDGMGRAEAVVQILYLGLVAGLLLRRSAVYWPSDNKIAVPLVLLALAAATAKDAAPRIGAVLAFCMALLAVPILITGGEQLEPAWLIPEVSAWSPALALILLLPNLPTGVRDGGKRLWFASAVTVASALLIQGTISYGVASGMKDAFYQTARTLGYLEPVAAVWSTLGWYAVTVWILEAARNMGEAASVGKRLPCVLAVGTAAGSVIIPQQPNVWFVTIIGLFLWVLRPFLRNLNHFKKTEK